MVHKIQGYTYLCLWVHYKGYNNEYSWTLDEEIRRVKSKLRSFCPHRIGMCHPYDIRMCLPTWKFSETHTFGIFMEDSSHRHGESLTNSTLLSPLWRMGDSSESSKLISMAWSFSCPACIQESNKRCFVRTKDVPITQEIPKNSMCCGKHTYCSRNYKSLRSSVYYLVKD